MLIPPNLKDSGMGWSCRYDHFNRLAEERSPIGTVKRTDCDLAGNVLREIHPQAYIENGEDGAAIRYEYDFEHESGSYLSNRYICGNGVEYLEQDGTVYSFQKDEKGGTFAPGDLLPTKNRS